MKRLLILLLFVILITATLDNIGLTSFNVKVILDQIFLNIAMFLNMAHIQPILNNIDNFISTILSMLSQIKLPNISLIEGLFILFVLGLVIDRFRSITNDINLLEKRRIKMDINYQKQLHHIIKRLHEISSDNPVESNNSVSKNKIDEINNIIDNLKSTYLRSKIIRRDLYAQNYRSKNEESSSPTKVTKKKITKRKITKKKIAKKVAKKITSTKKIEDKLSPEKEAIKELVDENQISQIDLARTYLESDDKTKAEEIIINVINTGDETEKHEARLLYMQLRK